jgi:aminoglycoside phosphotransferase (APT) family kinase protein
MPPEELQKRQRAITASLSRYRLAEILEPALSKRALKSFEQLQGGCSNINLLLRFDQVEPPVVMRIYVRDPSACQQEVSILASAARHLPVPEIIYADEKGEEDIGPYALYPYIEGMTFQELKFIGNREDMAQAAFAVGETLARLEAVPVPASLFSSPYAATDAFLNSPVLARRLGARDMERLGNFISGWLPEIGRLNEKNALVHGDFNNRNTLLRRQGDRWRVTGILDWELAFSGSPLWDVARFVCYERKVRPCREPYFSDGFRNGGGKLPGDWNEFSRVVNAVTAAQSLGRLDLSEHFVPDLCRLLATILDRRDPD